MGAEELNMKRKQQARQLAASKPPQRLPWRTDALAAREAARTEGRPCVLILNADSSAL